MITTISYQNPLDTSITYTATVTTLVNVGQPGQYVSTSYNDLTDKPTLGTASARNVPSSGDASASEAVLGNDSRLTNSRVALPHNHAISDVTGLQGALDSKYNTPAGDTSQYVTGNGSLATFPIAGQAGTLVRQVRNETGTTLTKGTVVYITGASGNKPTVTRAIATSDATSAQTFGVVQENILTNQNGYVVVRGDIAGIDTSAFPEGSQLYLSGSVAGSYTVTKPVAPLHLVYVGIVTRQHATQGQIEVAIQNGYELDELHDVLITSKQNNDVLVYEQSTNLWKNKTVVSALGYTPYNATNPNGYISAANLSLANNTSTSLDVLINTGTDVTLPSATTSLAGLMSSADKTKLNGIATAATANATDAQLRDRSTHTGTQLASTISDFNTAADARVVAGITGKENTITAGTTSQYWRGDKSWQVLDKTAVGLSAVDNTSDATKNSASVTLTNKTISGASNTLTNIAQSSVTNLTTDLAGKQNADADLTAIAALSGTGLARRTGADTWALDTNSYVRNLLVVGIPYIKAPSGTIATNGVVTLGTALPTTYDMGAWVYFPAGAVVSGLAGLYWVVFSSTTVGQVYTNFIDSSVPFNPTTRPSGTLTTAVGSNAAFTGVTGAVNMIHFDVPAGTINDNSQLVINEEFSYNLTAGSKQAGRFVGASTLAISTRTSAGGHESATSRLRFRGVKNNAFYYSSSEHNFAAATAYTRVTADHTNTITYRWTLNTAVATDHMVIEALSIIIEG
jgi:hypothetical protein